LLLNNFFSSIFILFLFISSDPNEDQFAKRLGAKKERVAKNEFQRLKNIARANKVNGKYNLLILVKILYSRNQNLNI